MILCPNCDAHPTGWCYKCNSEGWICATCKLPESKCECDDAEMYSDYMELGEPIG